MNEQNQLLEAFEINELEERVEFSTMFPTCCDRCDPDTGICYEEP